jgi:hypothetical protein
MESYQGLSQDLGLGRNRHVLFPLKGVNSASVNYGHESREEGPVSVPQPTRVRQITREEEEIMAKAATRADQSNIWWVFLLEGIAALIFGGLLLTSPAATLVAPSPLRGSTPPQ